MALLSLLAKLASVISLVVTLYQLTGFTTTLSEHNSYRAAVATAKATGNEQIVSSIPAVAAPDITQWASWLGPGAFALLSWAVSNWIKNPNLVAVLQGLLDSLKPQANIPPDVSPAKKDGQGNQGPPAVASTQTLPPGWQVEQIKTVEPSLFAHIEAIVALVSEDSSIRLELETKNGVTISISK